MYFFSPSPTFGISEIPFCTIPKAFTDEEIMSICNIGESLVLNKATINGSTENYDSIRKSKTSWIPHAKYEWLSNKIANIIRLANGQFYKFDLTGFAEDFQYTVYEGLGEHHYTWHQDFGDKESFSPRKLSFVLQLSSPKEYDGGDLQVYYKGEPETVVKEKGVVAIFPSWLLHRVTAVKSGIRRSLVVWSCGPSFR